MSFADPFILTLKREGKNATIKKKGKRREKKGRVRAWKKIHPKYLTESGFVIF